MDFQRHGNVDAAKQNCRNNRQKGRIRAVLLCFTTVLLYLFLSSCAHTDRDSFHPVKSVDELVGCYKRVNFEASVMKEMNKAEPWPEPHQVYCFHDDGTLRSMQSTNPINEPVGDIRVAMSRFPKVQTFSLLKPGVVLTHHKAADQAYIWLATVYSKPPQIPGRRLDSGDAHMFIVGDSGEPVYHRYLQRID